jgi:hypothetical protein
MYLPLKKKTPAQTRKIDSRRVIIRLLSSSLPRKTNHLTSTRSAIKNKTADKTFPWPFVIGVHPPALFSPEYFLLRRQSRVGADIRDFERFPTGKDSGGDCKAAKLRRISAIFTGVVEQKYEFLERGLIIIRHFEKLYPYIVIRRVHVRGRKRRGDAADKLDTALSRKE